MNAEGLRQLVSQLAASTTALSALGAALEARVSGAAPPLEIAEVVAALGMRDAVAGISSAEARPALGEIRHALLQGLARLGPGPAATGWTHADPEILEAAGEVSAGFPRILERLLPRLDGLAARLDAGAVFLDVGVGVAALSIEMARRWPRLRVVGVDVLAPALALARARVQDAGLGDHVELREQSIEDLPDVGAFDLGWVPSGFIPGHAVPAGLARVRRALRPGGWLLLATLNPGRDPLAAALTRLRTRELGGTAYTPEEAERLVADAGFTDVTTLPGPPAAVIALIAGRAAAG